jgi:NADH-quinone oxidoreductase subunit K|tara:strand:- start:769 stop:1071 length:303 start_codon:yes stop_codon:yes gene_type:complete
MNFLNFIFIPILLFIIGIFGIIFNRKNILLIIICVELILLSINCGFLITSSYLDDILGQIFAIFILTVAAAETSIGLAILILFWRLNGSIVVEFIKTLKG